MDDPWGSPWVDDSPSALPGVGSITRQSPAQSLQPGQTRESACKANGSPEGWATLATTRSVGVYGLTFVGDPAIEKWGSPTNVEPTSKAAGADNKSTWSSCDPRPSSVDTESLGTPKVSGVQLSPDPWVTEGPDTVPRGPDGIEATLPPKAQYISPLIKTTVAAAENADWGTLHTDVHETVESSKREVEGPASGHISKDVAEDHSDADTRKILTEINVLNGSPEAKPNHEGQMPSRASPSPSNASLAHETTESPQTSFEDESKHPKSGREKLSKVKELVQLYDGLVVDNTGPTTLKDRTDATPGDDHCGTNASEDSEDDFGDFEEGESNTSTNNILNGSAKAPATVEISESYDATEPSVEESESHDNISRNLDPVQFDVDISLLAEIFGNENAGSSNSISDSKESPGIYNVVLDSFSSIEERKTWYRISRYGTMKRNNTGDENYIRVDWAHSDVRVETLKIIAKWMEEKRLGGAMLLGSANRLGSLFGWDKANKAPMSTNPDHGNEATKENPASIPQKVPSQGPIGALSVVPHTGRVSLELTSPSKGRTKRDSPMAMSPQFSWSSSQPESKNSNVRSPNLPELKSVSASSPHSNRLSMAQIDRSLEVLPVPRVTPAMPDTGFSSVQQQDLSFPTVPTAGATVRNVSTVVQPGDASIDEDLGGVGVVSSTVRAEAQAPLSEQGHKLSETPLWNPNPIQSTNSNSSEAGHGTSKSASLSLPSSDFTDIGSTTSFSAPKSNESSMPTAASADDPWATADFSIFDTPMTVRAKPVATVPPVSPSRPKIPSRAPPPQPTSQKLGILKQAPLPKQQTQSHRKTREELEQDRIVRDIVQNLPDLSYMLRH